MSLNQRLTTEFSPCTPSAPQSRDLSIQTNRSSDKARVGRAHVQFAAAHYLSERILDR